MKYAVSVAVCLIVAFMLPSAISYDHNTLCGNLFLRATSLSNSGIDPRILFEEQGPVKFGGQGGKQDYETTVLTFEGCVERIDFSTGKVKEIPAGTEFDGKGGLKLLTAKQKDVPPEFRGTPLDEVSAQFELSQKIALSATDELEGFLDDKVIEINVDMLPDPVTGADSEGITRGVLDVIAHKMLSFKRDSRFSGKLHIGFISRSGDAVKLENILRQFKELDTVKYHALDNMLAVKARSARPGDKITISYLDDNGLFLNPALMLMSRAVTEEGVMAYPWHAFIDLAVGVLSIDRSLPLDRQQAAVDSIKMIFQDLFKGVIDTGSLDSLLKSFLSRDIEVSVIAARQLALPALQVIDYAEIEELNRMMREVASNA
jgi:hypothetical protein